MEFDAARLRSEPAIRELAELAIDAPSSFDIRYRRFVAVAKAEEGKIEDGCV